MDHLSSLLMRPQHHHLLVRLPKAPFGTATAMASSKTSSNFDSSGGAVFLVKLKHFKKYLVNGFS
jgi:hypothetical protein